MDPYFAYTKSDDVVSKIYVLLRRGLCSRPIVYIYQKTHTQKQNKTKQQQQKKTNKKKTKTNNNKKNKQNKQKNNNKKTTTTTKKQQQQKKKKSALMGLNVLDMTTNVSEISSLWLVSVAAQAGLCLTWSETPKTGFLVTSSLFPWQ